MKLKNLKLTNFGRHKELNHSWNTSIAGLIGPNGSGKSTVLTAIRWAFTGDLPDKGETYVRNFGSETGANNATVELTFAKDGQDVTIFRQVGKTNRRKLIYDGQELTKAKEIDEVMGELLGAEKSAVMASIFIQQGELDRMLFGEQAEREQLFMKLLRLTHLEKVGKILDDKIQRLGASITDLGPLIDDLNRNRDFAESAVAEVSHRVNQSYNWESDIETYQNYLQCVSNADAAVRAVESYNGIIASGQEKMRALLAGALSYTGEVLSSRESLEQAISELRPVVESVTAEVRESERMQQVQKYVRHFEAEAASLRIELDQLKQQVARIPKVLPEDLNALNVQIQALETKAALATSLADEERNKDQALAELDSYSTIPAPNIAEQELLLKEEASIKDELQFVNLKLTTRKAVLLDGTTHQCCPTCDQVLHPDSVSREAIQALETASRDLQALAARVRSEIVDWNRRDQEYKQTLQRLTDYVTLRTKSYQDIKIRFESIPDGDLEGLKSRRDFLLTESVKGQEIQTRLSNVSTKLAQAENNLSGVADADREKCKTWELEQLVSLQSTQQELSSQLKGLQDLHQVTRTLGQEISDAVLMKENKGKEHSYNLSRSMELKAAFSGKLQELLLRDIDVLAEMKSMQARYQEAVGELRQAQANLQTVKARQQELEERAALDAGKRALIEDLRRMRDTFTRSGLPMTYIRYRFAQLSDYTNPKLAKLDANFTVEPDPDQDVSFRFTRIDEAEPYSMSQNKLSGGQKVRLTVAFLLAQQELIIPDVGFLVIDEPSTHLDDEGVESLKALFVSLSQDLRNTDMQVLVCDHRPELQASFGSVLRLR